MLDRGKLAYAKPGLESIRSWRMRALASVPRFGEFADALHRIIVVALFLEHVQRPGRKRL